MVPQGNEPSTPTALTNRGKVSLLSLDAGRHLLLFVLWSVKLGLQSLKIEALYLLQRSPSLEQPSIAACFLAQAWLCRLKPQIERLSIMAVSRQRWRVIDFSRSVDNLLTLTASHLVTNSLTTNLSIISEMRQLAVGNQTMVKVNVAGQLFPLTAPCCHHQ